jgi:hypothetical protein
LQLSLAAQLRLLLAAFKGISPHDILETQNPVGCLKALYFENITSKLILRGSQVGRYSMEDEELEMESFPNVAMSEPPLAKTKLSPLRMEHIERTMSRISHSDLPSDIAQGTHEYIGEGNNEEEKKETLIFFLQESKRRPAFSA